MRRSGEWALALAQKRYENIVQRTYCGTQLSFSSGSIMAVLKDELRNSQHEMNVLKLRPEQQGQV